MGTNYYLHEDTCPHCGRGPESLHIGKSSFGWCFGLHVIPEENLDSLEAWRARWPAGIIKDEYGETITPEEMLRVITEREWAGRPMGETNMAENCAEPGPNKLLRHAIGRYCVGHGEGTWDLVPGEFS